MQLELTPENKKKQEEFRSFTDEFIVPFADEFDRDQKLSDAVIQRLAQNGLLVPTLPKKIGGAEMDSFTYGLLTEEVGRGCSSVRNLIAVQGMVAHAIEKWGNDAQKTKWLAKIAAGEIIAAFALTEPETGSDARNIQMSAAQNGNNYILNGTKKWISFGQRADLFLTFAQTEGSIGAFLIERENPSIAVAPIRDLLGLRASELAEIRFENCLVSSENLLSKGLFTFQAVATMALDFGRYSTACGCVGIAQACLEASLSYSQKRNQFKVPIGQHQLIQEKLTDMISSVRAARLLCYQAGFLRDKKSPDAVRSTLIAKYFASKIAFQAANDAVQIHGANGCAAEYPVQRYLRDAKIQEIIEGTSQIQQIQIAKLTLQSTLKTS